MERSVHSSMTEADVTAGPYSLLIVDDDELVLSVLYDLLAREAWHHISTATDPRTALELLRNEPFDLLITDYRMPGITGLDLIREATRLQPDLIGILVTGFVWPDAAAEATEAGAYDLMLKPLNIGEVCVRVRNACERIRLVRENRRCQRELEQAMRMTTRDAQRMTPSEAIAEIGLFPPNLSSAPKGTRKEEQMLNQLERLGKLYQMDLLTKEEFVLSKSKLFGRT